MFLQVLKCPTKIIYASRTHSQLVQVAEEVKKTVFAQDMHYTALGSRASLCIHPDVRTLDSVPKINAKCLELQKDKGDASLSIAIST